MYNLPAQPVDHEFMNFVNDEKTHLEIALNNTQKTNNVLNSPITFVEVRGSILLSKKNRVSAYLDDSRIRVEKQNWFRKGRSYEDHIFVLS